MIAAPQGCGNAARWFCGHRDRADQILKNGVLNVSSLFNHIIINALIDAKQYIGVADQLFRQLTVRSSSEQFRKRLEAVKRGEQETMDAAPSTKRSAMTDAPFAPLL